MLRKANSPVACRSTTDWYYAGLGTYGDKIIITATGNEGEFTTTDNSFESRVAMRFIDGGGEATAVQSVAVVQQQTGHCYDLQGRRVEQPSKGLYVKDGRKVIIK